MGNSGIGFEENTKKDHFVTNRKNFLALLFE